MKDFDLFLEATKGYKKVKREDLKLDLVDLFINDYGSFDSKTGKNIPPSVIGDFRYHGGPHHEYFLVGNGMYEALSEIGKWGNLVITDRQIFEMLKEYAENSGYKMNFKKYHIDHIVDNSYKDLDLIFYDSDRFVNRKGVISKDAEILEDLRDYASNVRRVKRKGTKENIELIKKLFPGMEVKKRSNVGSYSVWSRFASFIVDVEDNDRFSISYMSVRKLSGKDLENFIKLINRK